MSETRTIKRYTNRKLYDTRDSRYVTLSQIAAMVRDGEDIEVIDNATKENLTSLTLAQIIYEQEKRSSEVLPLSSLRELVRRGEARLADLTEGRVPQSDAHKGLFESSREAFEDWQHRVDDRLKSLLDGLAPFKQLQDEMLRVGQRVEELEGRLRRLAPTRRAPSNSAPEEVEKAGDTGE